MRQARSAPTPAYGQGPELKQIVGRNLVGLGGLGLIALTALVATALATWQATDPSLSNATSAPVRNALGRFGAVVADLAMQLIGLSSAFLLLPLVVVGWRLLASGRPDSAVVGSPCGWSPASRPRRRSPRCRCRSAGRCRSASAARSAT
ncbi:DNA translocase FtsK 4TM domain-containing protein [Methyloraptor flagellatus]|uniref:DNA translocase FtsK 4TM domain-containing protein n=1 Tax=Methyloraptor flagellatus TaxID=3162530 RepID=A0AAU7X8P1_9HYPH